MSGPSLPLVDDAPLRAAMRASERAGALLALQLLRRRLGALGAARVLGAVAAASLRGEPFPGRPVDARDRLTRRQAAGPVLVWRALRPRLGDAEALALTRELVLAAGVRFLAPLLARLDPAEVRDVAALSPFAGRFFNAEGTLERLEGDPPGVLFTVHRCRFVELLDAADARPLAPLFCEVDAAFFRPAYTPIRLERPSTLAAGGPICDFRFRAPGPSAE